MEEYGYGCQGSPNFVLARKLKAVKEDIVVKKKRVDYPKKKGMIILGTFHCLVTLSP